MGRRALVTPILVTACSAPSESVSPDPVDEVIVELPALTGRRIIVASDTADTRRGVTEGRDRRRVEMGDRPCVPGRLSASVTVTTSLTWTVSYSTSVGDGRLDPLVTESDSVLAVREIQTVSR